MNYRKQYGISTAGILAILTVVSFLVIGLISYVSNYNYGNRVEKQLAASWKNNENILSQYYLKVNEIAQVPTAYKDDLKEVYTAAIQGRYGENGSQAVFQWLQEQNPSIDSSMYIKLQQVMEAGRNEFQVAQTKLIDIKRGYETNLGYLWKGTWLSIAGYPTVDLDKYTIISTGAAQESFETGIDNGITLRKKED